MVAMIPNNKTQVNVDAEYHDLNSKAITDYSL